MLIECDECGRKISDKAANCPGCGAPVPKITYLDNMRFLLARALWWVQKRVDERRKPTDEQAATVVHYYTKAMNILRALGIDLSSKPADMQRLYFMMLLYLDEEEVICPAAARTASLIGFLDSLNSGWKLPPTSTSVSKEFAEEVDGYMAVEIFRNHLGLEDIRTELVNAINTRSAQLKAGS